MGLEALFIASSLVSAGGARQRGKAMERAAKINAAEVRRQAGEEAAAGETTRKIRAGLNRTRLAKSGVRAEGSPLAFLALQDMRATKDAHRILRAGRVRSTFLLNEADAARSNTRLSIAGELLGGAARVGLVRST